MTNLFDYVAWRGDLLFSEVPLNKIDALIFAQISYLNFDGLLEDKFSTQITLEELADLFKNAPDYEERSYMGMVINKRSPHLLIACGKSKRFKDVKICGYRSIYDEAKEEQFAAMTFLIDDEVIVTYRGTDDTIVGWKEDCNIAYMDRIPSQEDSILYLEQAAAACKGKISITGHSKGGNLALYTAVNCPEKTKKKISTVYNFDGPGFSKEFFTAPDYLKIKDKVVSVYPSFSVVGMIFNHGENYEIINSCGKAIMQHDALTWQVLGNEFVNEKSFTDASKFFHTAFNEWIDKLEPELRGKFVRAVFEVIEASGCKTNTELNNNKLAATGKMIKAFNNLDEESRQGVHRILRVLYQVVQSQLPIFSIIPLLSAR